MPGYGLERTREFGTLLALGMRPAQIGAMVWIELLVLALLGCSIGPQPAQALSSGFSIEASVSLGPRGCWPSSASPRGSIRRSRSLVHR